MTTLNQFTLAQLRAKLERRECSAPEILTDCLAAIAATEDTLGSFIEFDPTQHTRTAGASGALSGLPVGIKDLILVAGQPARAASRILEGFIAPYSATCVTNLQAQGAVSLGRLNMDEFAMGSSTETSAYGLTRNPWDISRVPGGSSGGSAAAVAGRQLPATLGTDTGGSIRQPAAFCGITGLKPTYGRVSRYGVIAFASSLDQVGPMARTAEDCALLLEAIAGHDPHDATSARQPVERWSAQLSEGPALTIGLPREYFGEGIEAGVRAAIERCIADLERQGHTFVEISLPSSQYAVGVYYLLATAEASSNLARYDGVRYGRRISGETLQAMYERTRGQGFGAEVQRRIMLGTFALSSGYYDAYYGRAQKVRQLITHEFHEAFARVDLILSPTTPTTAFAFGSRTQDPLQMYLADIFTISTNLAGLPGLSFPCGFADGLPVGAQLIAPAWREDRLLQTAHRYQLATDHHAQRAPYADGGSAHAKAVR